MNIIRRFFYFLFILAYTTRAYAQSPTVVQGRVLDKTTHEGLDYANVRFKGTLSGVKTDTAGYFTISTPQRAKTLVVSYLGYKSLEVAIQPGVTNHKDIELQASNVDLQELVVKPGRKKKREIDTSALYIFHHVVSHKDVNRPGNIETYHLKEYTKMVYSVLNPTPRLINVRPLRPVKFFFEKTDTTDKGEPFIPMLVQEDYRDIYYRKQKERKINVIHYRRLSGIKNPFILKLISYHFEVTDAYENVHVIFAKSFESPFSPGATAFYNFHVLDTAKVEGRTSYRLNFVGKNHEDLCLKGYAWIDSATWAIKFISYRPNEKANLNYINDLLVEQTFNLVADRQWLMTKEREVIEGNLVKKAKKLSVLVDKTTLRRDIAVDIPLPDSIMKNKDDIVESDAYKKKFTYMDSIRPRFDTLSPSEKLVYHHFDTLKTIPAYKRIKLLSTLLMTANLKAGPVDFGRLYRIASRNNVEGTRFRMGLFTNRDLSEKLFMGLYGAYGTKDHAFKYGANARFMLPAPSDRWHAIELEYKRDMLILGQENPLLTYDNISTLISATTLTKVMKTQQLNLYYERDWIKGLSSHITLSDWTFYSVPPVFTFMKADTRGNISPFNSFTTNEVSIDLRYCKTDYYFESYTYRTPLQTKTPSITLKYTAGIRNDLLGGDYTYHKFTLQFQHRVQWPAIGYSKLFARAGYILGDAPYPVSFVTSSNIGFIRDDYAFQSTAPFEFVTDKFVMVWWEHYFDGFFLNRVPFLNRLHIREFIQCKAIIGGYSSHNASLISVPEGMNTPYPVPYVESGFGFENILKIFQVDFLWRCTYRHNPDVANFSVKIGVYPGF